MHQGREGALINADNSSLTFINDLILDNNEKCANFAFDLSEALNEAFNAEI